MHSPRKVVIVGAAGRDFHNFHCLYRDNEAYRVVAFTAAQIPDIAGRTYPASLAGSLYPDGIPIVDESELENLVRRHQVDEVVFSYSDVSHQHVMEIGSRVIAAGAHYVLAGARPTMLPSRKPVIAVCAVRTGCGKSQTSRFVAAVLREQGWKVAVVRHPMPYGDLAAQAVQRFAEAADLDRHHCTIEEREEYEPHLENGSLVFAGVDYHRILAEAEAEADVILWDGGNNDLPFYRPDLHIVVTDPLRPGHETTFYPGMANLLMADVVVINKVDSASQEALQTVRGSISRWNPRAGVVEAESTIRLDRPVDLKGKRVLVVEDGPTLTHGQMPIGAGFVLARREGAVLVDPTVHAVGSIRATYEKYPHCRQVLPAMGYGDRQIAELAETIARTDADLVLIGTPIDLGRLIQVDKPMVRVRYDLKPIAGIDLAARVQQAVRSRRGA